jgi:hypothetical protein
MTFNKNKTINNSEPLKIWFWFLVVILFVSLFSYGYYVRSAIVNIVERQNIENSLADLSSRVLDLESEYIKVKNSITVELAQNMGFITSSNQKFVTKSVSGPGLSLVTFGN